MKKVKFTEDFANKKKGDFFECDSQLASQLIHKDKVAVIVDEKQFSKPYNALKVELREAKEALVKANEELKKVKDQLKGSEDALKEAKAEIKKLKK